MKTRSPAPSGSLEKRPAIGLPANSSSFRRLDKLAGSSSWAWAVEGDLDPANIQSNTFSLEWPPRSGKVFEVPEFDRAEWFSPDEARSRLVAAQRPLLDALLETLAETN